ncbi:MAG: hypothetical protein ACKPEA_16315 [Planctomycetota bacterium]
MRHALARIRHLKFGRKVTVIADDLDLSRQLSHVRSTKPSDSKARQGQAERQCRSGEGVATRSACP